MKKIQCKTDNNKKKKFNKVRIKINYSNKINKIVIIITITIKNRHYIKDQILKDLLPLYNI